MHRSPGVRCCCKNDGVRLAIFSTGLQDLDRPALLDWLAAQEVRELELGCGGYPGTRHADAQRLAADPAERRALQAELAARDIRLAALSCHGNPLHPDPAVARAHQADLLAALDAAHALEVPVLVCFSGQPGAAGVPNWPVVAWPDEYAALREQQWQTQLIPYWQPVAERARALGVSLAMELHGGFAVHSPGTLLRLRAACGPALGANLDPSHCWWQQIDPLAAVAALGSALVHVHLKDTVFNPAALALHGVLDPTPFDRPDERAWRFGMPGEGHDSDWWRRLLDSLDAQGYAGALSIEHEAPEPAGEGIPQTLRFIRALRGAQGPAC